MKKLAQQALLAGVTLSYGLFLISIYMTGMICRRITRADRYDDLGARIY